MAKVACKPPAGLWKLQGKRQLQNTSQTDLRWIQGFFRLRSLRVTKFKGMTIITGKKQVQLWVEKLLFCEFYILFYFLFIIMHNLENKKGDVCYSM